MIVEDLLIGNQPVLQRQGQLLLSLEGIAQTVLLACAAHPKREGLAAVAQGLASTDRPSGFGKPVREAAETISQGLGLLWDHQGFELLAVVIGIKRLLQPDAEISSLLSPQGNCREQSGPAQP